MNIVRAAAIAPSMVTTNAVNADADYNPATTYAAGAKCTHERRIWLSLQDANTGHTPGDTASTAWWSDAGPSNAWAMFDGEVNTTSIRAGSLTATVAPLGAPVVALLNVRGKTARVVSVFDGATVFDETKSLWDTSLISDWAEYFFGEPEFRTEAIFEGLPPVPGQSVTVTVEVPGADAQIGMCLLGRYFDAGAELYGLKRSGIDYSTVTFNEFGAVSIKKRAYAREVSTQTLLKNTAFDRVTRRLDQIASEPVLVLSGHPRFDGAITYGLVSYSVDLALFSHSYVSIEVKGLI